MDYTITNIQKRNEWTFQGNQMQDYAITLNGETNKGWIKLTQKFDTQPPKVGDTVHGQIEKKTTKNGTEYWKFKKINPNYQGGGGGSQFSGGGSGGSASKEDTEYIILMLEELTGRREKPENPKPRAEEKEDDFMKPVKLEDFDDPFKDML